MEEPQNALKRTVLERDGTISPPPKRRRTSQALESLSDLSFIDLTNPPEGPSHPRNESGAERIRLNNIASPIQLNTVDELPASSNTDTISLGSILGDPLIRECWLFNYLFNTDFIM